MNWTREHGAYWSDCGRYCVQRTVSTAIGPWFVTHSPAGKDAGWGPILVRYSRRMRDAKEAAERHARGEWSGDGVLLRDIDVLT